MGKNQQKECDLASSRQPAARKRTARRTIAAKPSRTRKSVFKVRAEGKVWQVLVPLLRRGEYTLTIREVAEETGLAVGAVHGTYAWGLYHQLRSEDRARRRARLVEMGQRADLW
jgi:hypothetical protein